MGVQDDQLSLLDAIGNMGSTGRAEGEREDRLPRTFGPVQEHLRAFDPEVVLVVGPRGAGKTELFRAVIEQGLLSKLAVRVPGVRLPPLERTRWVAGYPIGSEFPSERLLHEFAFHRKATDEQLLHGRESEQGPHVSLVARSCSRRQGAGAATTARSSLRVSGGPPKAGRKPSALAASPRAARAPESAR